MPLHNPLGIPERILTFGGPGSGKSFAFLRIAKFSQDTGSPAKFHVIDTDNAIRRMLATEFSDLTNVVVHDAREWTEVTGAMKAAQSLTPADWVSVDLISPTWDMVQEYFTEQVFGQEMDAFFLAARANAGPSGSKGSAFDGWKDWSVINKMYRSFQNSLLRAPCNVYAAAPADAVNLDSDEKETRNTFGPLGMKPRGQKHTAHFFHTVLFMTQDRAGTRRLTTAKDRGRTYHTGLELTDFTAQYLMGTAGWRP